MHVNQRRRLSNESMSTTKRALLSMEPGVAASPLRRTLPPRKVAPPPGAPAAPLISQGEFRSDLLRRFERAKPQTPPGSSVESPWATSASASHQELPPLRAASLSMARSSLSGFQVSSNCTWGTDEFACGKDFLRQPPSSQERTPPHRRLRPSDTTSWEPLDDGLGAFYEVERLKKQIARLTEMKCERDNYIEKLVAESDSAQKRHENDVLNQREQDASKISAKVQAMLEAQDRQHDSHTEMALSQQAKQYEAQLADERRRTETVQQQLDDRNAEVTALRAQVARHSIDLRQQYKEQRISSIRESSDCWQRAVLHSWTAAVANSRHEAHREAEVSRHTLNLRCQLRERACRVARECCDRGRQAVLHAWFAVLLAAQREAVHRRRVVQLSAEASAECYALRAEAKRQAFDLRKQRRVHGVSAVHANLDHHMHAVLWAWSQFASEGQRQANHQRLSDAISAEAVAECAKIRVETKRQISNLRSQRLMLGLAAVRAHSDSLRHLALRVWAQIAENDRRDRDFHSGVEALRKTDGTHHNVIHDALGHRRRLFLFMEARSRDARYLTQMLVLVAWVSSASICKQKLDSGQLAQSPSVDTPCAAPERSPARCSADALQRRYAENRQASGDLLEFHG